MGQHRRLPLWLAVFSGSLLLPDLEADLPAIVFVRREGEQPPPRTSEDLRPTVAPSDA